MDIKDKDKLNTLDNTSDLSVNSILLELIDTKSNETEYSLEDVLAEFGSTTKSVHSNATPAIADDPEPDEVELELYPLEYEGHDLAREDGADADEIQVAEIEFEQQAPNPVYKPAPKKISKIIRPWEDGVYGDVKIQPKTKGESKPVHNPADYQMSFGDVVPEHAPQTVEDYISRITLSKKKHRIRALLILILSLPVLYLSFYSVLGWYIPDFIGYLTNPFRFLLVLITLQCAIMLISIDTITSGIVKLFELKPDINSALAFSSFLTLTHTLTIMIKPEWGGWLPYTAITAVSFLFNTLGGYMTENTRLRTCRAASAVKSPSCVIVTENHDGSYAHRINDTDTEMFLSHINDTHVADTVWVFLSPIIIISTMVFAAVSSFGTGKPHAFFWAAAAISSVTVPFFSALSFSLPYSKLSKHLAGIGAAISGWFSATAFSGKLNVILRDNDLFPKGTVILHGLKMLGNQPLEKTLTYAASVMSRANSSLSDVFDDLLKSQFSKAEKVDRLKYHEAGGIEAEINQDSVLMGTAGFMFRMGIRVHENVNVKNAVFIAINMELSGVFNVNYKVNRDIRLSLLSLIRKKIRPVLAVIDFNLTPMLIENDFKLPVGSVEYPEVDDRIFYANEFNNKTLEPAAIVTRSGLHPYSSAVLSSKRLKKVTVRNVVLTALCAMIGMILMFYLTYTGSMESAAPGNVFLYLVLWIIPMYLLSIRVKRY